MMLLRGATSDLVMDEGPDTTGTHLYRPLGRLSDGFRVSSGKVQPKVGCGCPDRLLRQAVLQVSRASAQSAWSLVTPSPASVTCNVRSCPPVVSTLTGTVGEVPVSRSDVYFATPSTSTLKLTLPRSSISSSTPTLAVKAVQLPPIRTVTDDGACVPSPFAYCVPSSVRAAPSPAASSPLLCYL